MPERLQLANHLRADDLSARYRASEHPVERTHYQVLWIGPPGLAYQGHRDGQGLHAHLDSQARGPLQCAGARGAPRLSALQFRGAPLLSWQVEQDLKADLGKCPPEGDAWNGPRGRTLDE